LSLRAEQREGEFYFDAVVLSLGLAFRLKSEEASQKPYDFNSREHEPECLEKKFLKWWEYAPKLVQRIDDFWNS
jgi:hypothetical protein